MNKEKIPLLSNKFLDELAKEINDLYGFPKKEQDKEAPIHKEK